MTDTLPAELSELADFLGASPPFNELDRPQIEAAASALQITYHPQGERFERGARPAGLRILRSGAVDIRDGDGSLLDRLGEGESFHIDGLNAELGDVSATVIEDALIYLLPDERYRALRSAHRSVDRYFSGQRSRRLRRAARYEPQPHSMMREVHTVMSTDLLTVAPDELTQAVAKKMTERRVSSAFIVQGGDLLGIVTDRDVRVRYAATGLPPSTPVSRIMTPDPESIAGTDTLFGTMLLMTQRGYHHLPVMAEGRLSGVVTTSDLILARQDDPVYLVQHISRADSVEELVELAQGMPNLMVQWVNSGMRAQQVSRILTAISDAVTQRLIRLAEASLGPAPVSYCWMGFGSQARGEQLLGADQDNGLLLANDYGDQHADYFEALAGFVCDGLNACGYDYCSGEVMASNPEWRQPLSTWLRYVDRWTNSPTPDAVMRVSIFFDLRGIHGDTSLAEELQAHMLERASSNTIFLAALAANALDASPPLGVFRRFVVDRDGEHRDSLDLKKRGILLATDTARLHALAHRVAAVNTDERLQALARGRHMAMGDSRNLADALRFLQQLRIRHQADQVSRGEKPDNFLKPRELPKLAREQLRDAFTILDDAQAALRQAYRAGLG
jgi:CBS domain-containing protein